MDLDMAGGVGVGPSSSPILAFPGPSQANFPATANYDPSNYPSSNYPSSNYPPSSYDLPSSFINTNAAHLFNQQRLAHVVDAASGIPPRNMRKRKSESQDNERLSKRLSLLNLEQNGQKLYVPVESPQLRPTTTDTSTSGRPLAPIPESDSMHLDDTKHKVYIYNLDDELSDSDNDNNSSSGLNGNNRDGRLLFLPDIDAHLRRTRIPPSVMPNSDGELAGMQMVLYSEPTSLTVPREQDSVRKAIIEARARHRLKQQEEREQQSKPAVAASSDDAPMDSSPSPVPPASSTTFNGINGPGVFNNTAFTNHNRMDDNQVMDQAIDQDGDPDAMDMD
ncbi:hypothetical protein F5B20DRAFT_257746 [Whalleya microplaca]|nr:hypothetical protein F5B20DRAFT_257746 [Whalleya microplaca]